MKLPHPSNKTTVSSYHASPISYVFTNNLTTSLFSVLVSYCTTKSKTCMPSPVSRWPMLTGGTVIEAHLKCIADDHGSGSNINGYDDYNDSDD